MITLYTFGPGFGLPDPSPFVMKAEVLLKMSGLPYRTDTSGFRKAPKGKLPYIDDEGTLVADSTFIRFHIEKKYGFDFDKGLSAEQQGIAWAVEKLLEDNLYFAAVHERWMIDANFSSGPAVFFKSIPMPLRPAITFAVRRGVKNMLWKQGTGRHSREDLIQLGVRAIDALAAILGGKPYLMDAIPCGADATAFAFAAGLLSNVFDTPLRSNAQKHANLVAYSGRMMAQYYPDFRAAA